MEGLIPMVYKAMKRNRSRRQYCSLSSSPASAAQTNYNIADFYIDPNQANYVYVPPPPPAASSSSTPHDQHHRLSLDTIFNVNNNGGFSTVPAPPELEQKSSPTNNIINGQVIQHRRHKSVSVSVSSPPKQLVRFRSHRRIFSCMTCGVVPS